MFDVKTIKEMKNLFYEVYTTAIMPLRPSRNPKLLDGAQLVLYEWEKTIKELLNKTKG